MRRINYRIFIALGLVNSVYTGYNYQSGNYWPSINNKIVDYEWNNLRSVIAKRFTFRKGLIYISVYRYIVTLDTH